MADPLEIVMNETTHRFEAKLGEEVAFAEYELQPGSILLPHTVVPPAFEGKGVGSGLAKAALGYAREHGLSVKPACPFIAGYIKKHPQWHDLVDRAWRARLKI